MITADSGRTNAVVEDRDLAGRVQLVDPGGAVLEVDLDRLVVEPLLRERDAHAGAVRAARVRRRASRLEAHRTGDRLVQLVRRAAGRPATAPCARRARTSSRSAPVRRATSVGFASQRELVALAAARRRTSAPRGTRRPCGPARRAGSARPRPARARARRRPRRAGARARARAAPAPRGRRRSAGRESGSSRSRPRRPAGASSRGTNCATARSTEASSSLCTCIDARDSAGGHVREPALERVDGRRHDERDLLEAEPRPDVARVRCSSISTSRLTRVAPFSFTSSTHARTSAFATPRRARPRADVDEHEVRPPAVGRGRRARQPVPTAVRRPRRCRRRRRRGWPRRRPTPPPTSPAPCPAARDLALELLPELAQSRSRPRGARGGCSRADASVAPVSR